VRELHEETGIQAVDLTFVAVAEFDSRSRNAGTPSHLPTSPPGRAHTDHNDEALDFRWWSPTSPIDNDMSPLDAEIALRVLHFSSS
jgi:8-oxo-dGTP diphosphatase